MICVRMVVHCYLPGRGSSIPIDLFTFTRAPLIGLPVKKLSVHDSGDFMAIGFIHKVELVIKLKFFYWNDEGFANPVKDFKWFNVPGVKLSSLPELDDTFSSKRLNLRFLLVMLRLELHTTSVLAVGKLTLGLLPRYTSCDSGNDKSLTLVVDCFQWLALCFYSSWSSDPPCCPDGFLPSIMLLVVTIVSVVIVLVSVILVVVLVSSIVKLSFVITGFEAVTFPSILQGNPPMKTSIIFSEYGTIVGHKTANSWNLLTGGAKRSVEECDRKRACFRGGKISSGRKKFRGSNCGNNTRDGGGAIEPGGGGIVRCYLPRWRSSIPIDLFTFIRASSTGPLVKKLTIDNSEDFMAIGLEVIKVIREEENKPIIDPKEAIFTKAGETFKKVQDAEHEVLKRESTLKRYERLKKNHEELRIQSTLPALVPEQVSSQTLGRKRKHIELEPKIKVPRLECNRSLPKGVLFVNNMVIEEPEYGIFFTDVFGDQEF
nr:hypothetical protein [Tanacetum cinerariifolium]